MSFTVFDPTDGPAPRAFTLANRPASLEGKVIGILDNGKAKSDLLIREVQELLRTEAGVVNFVMLRKPSAYRPAPDDQLDELARRTDAVITGIGDWSSCSSSSLLDGILLERRGTPAAAILTDAFVPNADAIAEAHGAAGYAFALVPHPLASASHEELAQEAKQLLPRLMRLLVQV